MAEEWQVVAVPNGFALSNGKGVIKHTKEETRFLKNWICPDFGNDDQISFARAAEMAGIDPYRIQFFEI
ncbi:hypothetical protein ACEQPO_05755 [Bacillus sp. SL00103]